MPLGLLALIDVVAVGMGMGVPAFAILLGFPAGWWVARTRGLRTALLWGAALAALTLAMMLVIWGPQFALISAPDFDAAEWGIPLVLYTSEASFWGWQALMIVISPVLQFMASATAAALVSASGRTAEPESSSAEKPQA